MLINERWATEMGDLDLCKGLVATSLTESGRTRIMGRYRFGHALSVR